MNIADPKLKAYADNHTTEESATLKELVKTSEEKLEFADMISGRVVGRFLAMLVCLTGAKHILEIGTFTGYSALSMAEVLPEDGELITCELNERYEAIARTFFKKSEHGHKIHLKMGEALETIEKIDGVFDLAFLDADKLNYPAYYSAILPKLKKGGLIVIDNVLWGGAVLAPEDEKAETIDRLNKIIMDDDRVEQVMLTVRDGLLMVRKQ